MILFSLRLAWNPSSWDAVEQKMQKVEARVYTSADSFVEEEKRAPRKSLTEGVENISDLGQNHKPVMIVFYIMPC